MIFVKSLLIFIFDIIDQYFHQKKIIKILNSLNLPISIFLDVGSHKGLYSDLFLKSFKIKKGYLFEPQKKIFLYLKKKYKKNKLIKVFNIAISNKEKMQNIYINKHDLTSSLKELNYENKYLKLKSKIFQSQVKNMIIKKYKIQTKKLSKIITINKINVIDLIKIDTEGNELEVLKGLEDQIKKIKIILIEFRNDNIYLNYESSKIKNYLKRKKFILYKKVKFPLTTWEDRIYINNNFN